MHSSLIAWIMRAIPFGTIIMYGALGETVTEKSGNLNLGVPGIMYIGAISGVVCGFFFQADLAGHTLHKGSAQVQAGTPGILIHAKPLGNIGVGLGHNDNAAGDADQHKDQQDSNNQ